MAFILPAEKKLKCSIHYKNTNQELLDAMLLLDALTIIKIPGNSKLDFLEAKGKILLMLPQRMLPLKEPIAVTPL